MCNRDSEFHGTFLGIQKMDRDVLYWQSSSTDQAFATLHHPTCPAHDERWVSAQQVLLLGWAWLIEPLFAPALKELYAIFPCQCELTLY